MNDSPPVADGNASFTIDLGAASSSDSSSAGLDPTPLPGINTDDDVAAIVLDSMARWSTLETSGPVTVTTVTLATRPVSAVTVPVTLSIAGRGTVSPTALTFDGSSWNVPVTVSLDPTDDSTRNGDAAIRGDLNTGAGAGLLAADAACSSQGAGNYKALLALGARRPGTSSWVILPGYAYLRGSSVLIGVADGRGQLPDPDDRSAASGRVTLVPALGAGGAHVGLRLWF